MVRGLTFAALLTSASALIAGQQASTTVTISARLTIVREPTTDLLVHITNLRSAALHYYAVAVGDRTFYWNRSIMSQENLPIRPGQRQSHRVAVADAYSARAVVTVLGFSDGYFEGEREALQRYFAEHGTPAGSSITDKRPTFVDGRSATLTTVPVPGERVVEILDNLRKLPIDAWTISYPAGGEPGNRTTVRMDTCPGGAAIAPGESRRFVNASPKEIGAPFKAELRMVLFRDGHFEGDRTEADQVFGRRKTQGVTCSR